MDVMAQYNKLGNTERDLAVKNELAQSIVSRVEATGGRYLERDSKSSIITVASPEREFERVWKRLIEKKCVGDTIKRALLLQPGISHSANRVVATTSHSEAAG